MPWPMRMESMALWMPATFPGKKERRKNGKEAERTGKKQKEQERSRKNGKEVERTGKSLPSVAGSFYIPFWLFWPP